MAAACSWERRWKCVVAAAYEFPIRIWNRLKTTEPTSKYDMWTQTTVSFPFFTLHMLWKVITHGWTSADERESGKNRRNETTPTAHNSKVDTKREKNNINFNSILLLTFLTSTDDVNGNTELEKLHQALGRSLVAIESSANYVENVVVRNAWPLSDDEQRIPWINHEECIPPSTLAYPSALAMASHIHTQWHMERSLVA